MRVFTAARAAYGLGVLTAPRRLLQAPGSSPAPAAVVAVVRLLGARHVGQAVASAGRVGMPVLLVGAEVDAAHALSMLVLAGLDPRRRRIALLDALVAAGFMAAGVFLARSGAAVARQAVARPGQGAHRADQLAAFRDRMAERIAEVTVPAKVRRWLDGGAR